MRENIFFRARDSRYFHFSTANIKQQPDRFSKGIFYGFHPLNDEEEKMSAGVATLQNGSEEVIFLEYVFIES